MVDKIIDTFPVTATISNRKRFVFVGQFICSLACTGIAVRDDVERIFKTIYKLNIFCT